MKKLINAHLAGLYFHYFGGLLLCACEGWTIFGLSLIYLHNITTEVKTQTLQNFCNKAYIRIHFFFFFSHEKFLKRLVCLPSFLCSIQYLFNLLTLSYMITFLHCINWTLWCSHWQFYFWSPYVIIRRYFLLSRLARTLILIVKNCENIFKLKG